MSNTEISEYQKEHSVLFCKEIPDVLSNFFDSSTICGFQLKLESIRTSRYFVQLAPLIGFEPCLILTKLSTLLVGE